MLSNSGLQINHKSDTVGIKNVYHGSPSVIEKFVLDFVGSENGTTGGGFGVYFTESKSEAFTYGENVHHCILNLKSALSNQSVTLTKFEVMDLLRKLFDVGINYIENYGYQEFNNKILDSVAEELMKASKNDVDIIGDIVNSLGNHAEVLKAISDMGYTHTVDTDTAIINNIIHYIVYDVNCIQIIKNFTLDTV